MRGIDVYIVVLIDLTYRTPMRTGEAEAVRVLAIDPQIYFTYGYAAAVLAGTDLPDGTDLTGRWIVFYAAKPGVCTISITSTTQGTPDALSKTLTVLPKPELAVDANRDGDIKLSSNDTSDATSVDKPYRFWINDDDDGDGSDTTGDDIPGVGASDYLTTLNGGDMGTMQGNRDLIDWFPVVLDIKQLLAALPPSSTVSYKLKQADGALNFVYTNLTRDQTLSYQRTPLSSGFGPDLTQAPGSAYKRRVTAAGVDLFNAPTGSPQLLDAIQNHNGGVILVEGRAMSNAPLVLSVENNGNVVTEVRLYLSINGVETMFQHLNLRDLNFTGLVGTNGDPAPATSMDDPVGFPDAQNSNDRWLIFLHGYNVGGQKARGWNAEMFKRFYWSGNKARFVAVSWFGNPDDAPLMLPSDYHLAVRNAMVTAQHLAPVINNLPGIKTTVSHSLGCEVIASAIADHGMVVNKACFVDAALARECFDGEITSEANGMTPALWREYDPGFYAANWYQLFSGTSDARKTLTWRNRFSSAATTDATPYVVNFYSSTEDVLASNEGEVPTWWLAGLTRTQFRGSYTWVFQEKAKGVKEDYLLGLTHAGSLYGGWGFNLNDPVFTNDPKWYYPFTNQVGTPGRRPKYAGEISSPQVYWDALKRTPFFEAGWGRWDPNHPDQELVDTNAHDGPDWIFDLYGATTGNTQASDPLKRGELLAEAIPALTWPMGSRASSQIATSKQFDLPSLTDNWPRDKINAVPEWRHSDMHDVAYLYQYRFFDQVVSLSKQ